jgi:hypothetical protein
LATILEEFVLILGLDASKFTKEQKAAIASLKKTREDSEQEAKKIEQAWKSHLEGAISGIKREAIGLAALLIGGAGLKNFVANIIQTDSSVGRLAKTMDISVSELARWRTAAYLSGGSAEGITSSLQGLTSEIQSFQLTGQSTLLPYLNQLGTGFTDSNDKIKTATQLYLDVADALKKLDPARAAEFGKVLHLDNDSINMIIRGRQELQRLLDVAGRINPTTKENVELATDLQRAWRTIEQLVEGAARQTEPAATGLLDYYSRIIAQLRRLWRGQSLGTEEDLRKELGQPGRAGSPPAIAPKAAGAGDVSLGTLALKSALESEFPGIRVTALNDAYHAGTGSKHAQGLAIDFAIPDPSKSAEIAAKVRARLGAGGSVQDEYLNPSARSTGPHIHVQFNTPEAAVAFYGRGGAATGGSVDNRKTSSSEIKIGTVNVVTQAKDAGGIARDFVGAVDDAAKANYGLA